MWNSVMMTLAQGSRQGGGEYNISEQMGRIAALCIFAIIVVFIVQKVFGKGKKKNR